MICIQREGSRRPCLTHLTPAVLWDCLRGDNPGLDVVAFSQRVELKMDEAGTCCVCLAGQSWRNGRGKEETLTVVRLSAAGAAVLV